MALCSALRLMDGAEMGARGSQQGRGIARLRPGHPHHLLATLEQRLAVGLGSAHATCPEGTGALSAPHAAHGPPNLTAASFADGAVYALGGMGADTSPQALVRVYEPAKDHWQPLPSMPTPCYGASAFLQGNKIFVLGRCHWGKLNIPPCPCPLPPLPPWNRE